MVHGSIIPSLSPYTSYSAADQDRDAERAHADRVERAVEDLHEAIQGGGYVDLQDAWTDIGFVYRRDGVDLSEVLAECPDLLDNARWRPTPLVEGEIEVVS